MRAADRINKFHALVIEMRRMGWTVFRAGDDVTVRPPKSVEMPSRTERMDSHAFRKFAEAALKSAA